jgi:hypothetical protein
MKRLLLVTAVSVLLAAPAAAATPEAAKPPTAWNVNATIIEACSCPTFCQCYFNTSPAGHHHESGEQHYCRFNNAYKVNHGAYGSVKLDGAKFWVSGDLGGDFSKGMTDWAVVTFDRAVSAAQREAIEAVLATVYPVKWGSLTTSEGTIAWNAGKDEAWATIDDGKTAEVRLKRFAGMTNEPVVIRNLRYFGASHNDGFIVMPNEVEAYRVGDRPYEFKGTNGFMITIQAESKGTPPAKAASGR